jgi:endonuclease/exonuclease/phosphatase family metal-dependent hydrolase
MAERLPRARRALALAIAAGLALQGAPACNGEQEFAIRRKRGSTGQAGAADGDALRPGDGAALAAAGELALLTWNIEWFQDPERGPADDARQLEAVQGVLAQARADLAGLQEISVPARLAALLEHMPQYALAVSSYEWPQQTALLYRPAHFELVAARVVAGLDDAGRPPLEVELVAADGSALTVIVVHAKAGGDDASWQRRARFAEGLERHLDALLGPVIVLGDFNDGFTRSIAAGRPSPYARFSAGSGYGAPTAALEGGAERSTVWGETVDHILLSDGLAARIDPQSVDVLRDELLARDPRFWDDVSDHAPVVARLAGH